MFAGVTTFEHGVGRKAVWIKDSAHVITCAMPGAGKFTTSLGLNAIFHSGSGVWLSPKPEIADFILGRRVDSTIFDRPDLCINSDGVLALTRAVSRRCAIICRTREDSLLIRRGKVPIRHLSMTL